MSASLLPYGESRKLPLDSTRGLRGIFEYWIRRRHFSACASLSCEYTLDGLRSRRYFRDGIDLTLSGRNLAVWTNYSGYDPEINLFGTNAGGIGSVQTTRQIAASISAATPFPRLAAQRADHFLTLGEFTNENDETVSGRLRP